MAVVRILLVDDDEIVCFTLAALLKEYEFEVTTAVNVSEALKLISSETYDVLLSDLHMPGAGDGLTVVSAMRHANPKAITMLLSAFPEMDAAAQAILLQADEILVKPMDIKALVAAIRYRLKNGSPDVRVVETVAAILERSSPKAIREWFELVQTDELVMAVPLNQEQRCGHLPKVFHDLVARLLSCRPRQQRGSITRSGSARCNTSQARLHGCDDGRRVAYVAGHHL
jgi:DNA-binding response OmpR family regulator